MFEVGDIVEAYRVRGKVDEIDSDPNNLYPVLVWFDSLYSDCFTLDGKTRSWHKESSLKLIERPKKKVTRSFVGTILEANQGNKLIIDGHLEVTDIPNLEDVKVYNNVKVTYEYEE